MFNQGFRLNQFHGEIKQLGDLWHQVSQLCFKRIEYCSNKTQQKFKSIVDIGKFQESLTTNCDLNRWSKTFYKH